VVSERFRPQSRTRLGWTGARRTPARDRHPCRGKSDCGQACQHKAGR
jgi:hypothetical protein